MRMGYLGRLSDLPLNGHIMQPQGLADMVRSNNQIGILLGYKSSLFIFCLILSFQLHFSLIIIVHKVYY